jgi:NAD(P)-dependent dehydrogenase (short-subunit alcohol dehydrogenase family)
VTYTQCDVTRWDELLNLHEVAIRNYGTVDVVVANAGIPEVEDIFEDKFDEKGRLLPPKHLVNEVNLKGVFNSTHPQTTYLTSAVKLAIHYFRKLEKKGVIVMISSTAGYLGEPIPAYSAAKHGVLPPISKLTMI